MTRMTRRKVRISGGCGANPAEPTAAERLPVVFVAPTHLALDIALRILCSNRLALIGLGSALADAEFDFHSAVLEVHRKRNDRHPLTVNLVT
jgi:hypothetical protein